MFPTLSAALLACLFAWGPVELPTQYAASASGRAPNPLATLAGRWVGGRESAYPNLCLTGWNAERNAAFQTMPWWSAIVTVVHSSSRERRRNRKYGIYKQYGVYSSINIFFQGWICTWLVSESVFFIDTHSPVFSHSVLGRREFEQGCKMMDSLFGFILIVKALLIRKVYYESFN